MLYLNSLLFSQLISWSSGMKSKMDSFEVKKPIYLFQHHDTLLLNYIFLIFVEKNQHTL
jgi:hypothetical protein